MKDLRNEWESFAARLNSARSICLLTDFDGTLSPLVDRPELAALPPRARDVLESLAANKRVTLGVVSGRALPDLMAKIGLNGIWYVGNHGFEIRAPSGEERRFYDPEDVRFLDTLRDEFLDRAASIPGILVEHKGPVIALHYRLVEVARVHEVEKLFLAVVQKHQRRVMIARGIKLLEARLRGSQDKGTAVRFIRRELPSATLILYFGDDQTDRDAFRALQNVGITVEVGSQHLGFADYNLPDPQLAVEALDRIDLELRGRRTDRRVPPKRRP